MLHTSYLERVVATAEREISNAQHHLGIIAMKDQLKLFEIEPLPRAIPFPLMRYMEAA
jgi:hypothetical protein